MPDHPNNARPVQLHVIHDLGGGSAKWLVDYTEADTARVNLVLRSISHDSAAGTGVALFANATDEAPLRFWSFSTPIYGTTASHAEYRKALDEVIASHGVGAILVSSVIGHSLDALATHLPTVVVTHDYFPYSASINLYAADDERFNPFAGYPPAEQLEARERFMDLVQRSNVTVAAPSESVVENLSRLDERFANVAFVIIPHGYGHPMSALPAAEPGPDERLRVIVLGQLSPAKGYELLREALPRITRFADLYLVGCRELGEAFRFDSHVHLVSHYEPQDLATHVSHINPQLGLLMSVVPETFSYALSELMMLGVPVAATRIGSFAERIEHEVNGYLYKPDADSMVQALRAIDADRGLLARVRQAVRQWRPRSAAEMVADYHRVAPIAARPAAAKPEATAAPGTAVEQALATQALTLAQMWKQVKSVTTELHAVNEARHRTESRRQSDRREFAGVRKSLEDRLAAFARELADRQDRLADGERQIQNLSVQLHARNLHIGEIYASTSWRVSAPIRVVGHLVRRMKIVSRVAMQIARDPANLPETSRKVLSAWRAGGLAEVARTLKGLQSDRSRSDAWGDYRERLATEVLPQVEEAVEAMASRPLISVIVPTFNPVEDMLRQMLDSVRRQIYPDWELCIADDASTEPYVRRVLEEYAAADRRIRVHYGLLNGGVSHASNRALEMAQGTHVVLLDHDDLLEEQALYRVAETIVEDDADMFYSDEVLVTPDGNTVRRYTYRPAFSREYLRSHPYIVHLVGFRTSLLRELGGFDETLRISQDYDLILRASEKARTIVHIPEILYRWRIHGASAGVAKMDQVMEISKSVLRRHLQRCGDEGEVGDGAIFNLFDTRYALRAGHKVAIIIPTKNLGALLRQCIESIRATVSEAAYDIVVVDHESDDAETRAYLASIAGEVRVLRYKGVFNFSAINNFAVGQLAAGYSHYLLCNNDIEAIGPGWLERMLELAQQPSIGIVGAMLYYPDRHTIQHAGVCVGLFGAAEHYAKRLRVDDESLERGYGELLKVNREVAAVTAACLLIRKDAFDEVSGFDEAIAVGFGDVDMCLRVAERGYRVVFSPHVTLVHHESYTRGTSTTDPHPEDSALYQLKWKPMLQAGDPYYSPGLTRTATNWEVRNPLHCSFAIRRRVARQKSFGGREFVTFSPADVRSVP